MRSSGLLLKLLAPIGYLDSHSETPTPFFLGLVVHSYCTQLLGNMLRKPSAHFGQNDCWNLEHRLLALQRHQRVRTKTTCIFMTTWVIVLRDYTSKLYLLGIRYAYIAFVSIQIAISPSFNPEVRSQLRGFRSVSRYWHHANHNLRSRAISHSPQSECTPWVVQTGGGAHIVPFACKSLTLLLSTLIHSFP